MFYFHPNKLKSLKFNLPKGTYYSVNDIVSTHSFKPYPLIPLPSYDNKYTVGEIKVKAGNNPHKASINLRHDNILVDTKIKELEYKPAKVFVLSHERGHYHFNGNGEESENLCDDYAHNAMILAGYNPTQIEIAKNILFQKNILRKKCLSNKMNLIHTVR